MGDVAIPIGFRNIQEIPTPTCALARNDTIFRQLEKIMKSLLTREAFSVILYLTFKLIVK